MNSLRRFVKNSWAKSPPIFILVAANLVVAIGWGFWNLRQRDDMRQEGLREYKIAIGTSIGMGGYTPTEAEKLYQLGGKAVTTKMLSSEDINFLLAILEDTKRLRGLLTPFIRASKALGILRDATNLTPQDRTRMRTALLTFLQSEPFDERDSVAAYTADVLLHVGKGADRDGLIRLSEASPPLRKKTIEERLKRWSTERGARS